MDEAQKLYEKVQNGSIKIKKAQLNRLSALVKAIEMQKQAELELQKIEIGLMYERHIYMGKIDLCNRILIRNAGLKKVALKEMKKIIFSESKDFVLSPGQPTV